MKKLISGLVIGGILATGVCTYAETTGWTATKASFKVMVRGEEFISENPAIVVEGRTYLPLRAMGDALGVNVEWNEELRQAEVAMSEKPPETSAVKPPAETAADAVTSWTATKASFKVMVRGDEFISENPPIVVEGRTYLPLRALGDALGVDVEWNEELRQAEVDMKSTDVPDTTPVPSSSPVPNVTPLPVSTTIVAIEAKAGTTVEVPINFSIPDVKGVNTCDFTVAFNGENMEFIEATAGDIVKDPDTNFAYNYKSKESLIKFLYLNYNMDEVGAISTSGVFATLKFKVKENVEAGKNVLALHGTPTFGDTSLKAAKVEINAGEVTVAE